MSTLWRVLTRRKVLDNDAGSETTLARVLNTFDLTALGVGSTLGVGVYVLAGQVAKNTAGPAVVLSFLIAAIASVFAGLCYAEFGARTPKAGSAYIYSYVCVGEFIAFVIGWNLILEYIIGSASVAKGLSSYIDNLCNGTLSNTFRQWAPIDLPYLSPYFDLLAFSVPIILSVALAFGMKESSLVNNIFTTCNIGVVLFVIVAGAMNAHLSNWSIKPDDVKNATNGTNIGHGGFFPFGIQGVIKGAATCFYGFVGFDCIATTGEEVKNPRKAIPVAIIFSLLIIFLAYFGTSTVLTLMVPYYNQDPDAPIPFAFESIHWDVAAHIVTFGAIFGLYASLFGAMFPLPRILYAMASDGLIFKFLGRVNERFKTPVIGTLLAGLFTGIMAGIFALDSLVNMMSIGTLLAYTIVAACVLLLRYSVDEEGYMPIPGLSDSDEDRYVEGHPHVDPINASEETILTDTTEENTGVLKQLFNFDKIKFPNKTSQAIVSVDIFLFCILCFLIALCALYLRHDIVNREVIPLSIVTVILILMALTMCSIACQPVSRTILSFQVPWVPLIPALSIFCNIYLMVMLDIATWIRFVVWMVLGLPIFYFTQRCCSGLNVTNDTHTQGYSNKSFYGDNLVYSTENVLHLDESVIIEDKIITSLENEENSDKTVVQTPSPSRVIETLDLVIHSYEDDTALPFVSSDSEINPVIVSSNKPLTGDFRDTPNSALRSILLNSLNDGYAIENVDDSENNLGSKNFQLSPSSAEETEQVSTLADEQIETIKNVDVMDNVTHNLTEKLNDQISSSGSESSYASAKSSVDMGQKVSDLNSLSDTENIVPLQLTPQLPPPPPPPPPLPLDIENITHFSLKKTHPYEENLEDSNTVLKDAGKQKAKSRELPMIINRNTLSSVNLKHVHRPSIERSRSHEDTQKTQLEPADSGVQADESKTAQFSPIVNLRHVNRPSLENKKNDANTTVLSNDSKTTKSSRYLKSKSVSELQTKNNGNSSNTLKRMDISKDVINSVKLKPVVRPSLSLKRETKSDLPDTVKFGTLEFEEFKNELNQKLSKSAKILREPSFVDPKSIAGKPKVKIERENVIDDHLDLAKARATMESEVGNKLNYLKNLEKNENISKNAAEAYDLMSDDTEQIENND